MGLLRAIFIAFVFLTPQLVCANSHHVDFRNFTYPWSGPEGWSGNLEWLDPTEQRQVTLKNGHWELPDEEYGETGERRPVFAGLTLEEVKYGRLSGEARECAIVVLRFDSGGTQYSYYVYVYAFERSRVRMLAYFHSGDRAYLGLYRVYFSRSRLIVELFDPEHLLGDCCSEGLVRTTFRLHHGKFEETGQKEFLKTDDTSRLPVSMFGIHQ